jgi:hypothetical protein
MAICLSHGGGRTIYSSEKPTNELLVGTADGVCLLVRDRYGAPWKLARQSLHGYHVCALVIEPLSGTAFAGTHNGGVARSRDLGETWEFCNRGLNSTNVYSLNYSQSRDKLRIYAGSEPAHMFVSETLGADWRELDALRSVPSVSEWFFPAPPHVAHVKFVTFDPQDPECIYACIEQGALLKSADGGTSWQQLHGPNNSLMRKTKGDSHRLIIRPSNPKEMFLPTGYGMQRSADGGLSWTDDSKRTPWIGYPDPMVFHPKHDELMFVAGARRNPGLWPRTKGADSKVARSRDAGNTWELVGKGLAEPLKANFEAMTIEAWDGSCAIYLANTDGEIHCSDDEGESWQRIAAGLPAVSKGAHYKILRGDFGRAA